MTKPQFEKLVYKIAKKMKLDKNIVDICWFRQSKPNEKGDIVTGVASFSNVLYFNELQIIDMYKTSINELIIHELSHLLQYKKEFKNDKGHDAEFFKDFKYYFKKLKNIK
mgnify:CR=1 FL=1